jgi:DeoR/GlpR family transcriptional regulator of sugar metabolism
MAGHRTADGEGVGMTVSGSIPSETRRRALLERLSVDGALRLEESATSWQVHPMTIRRDFEVFVDRGLARRVRGGIIAVDPDDFEHRSHRNVAAKQAIAAKLRTLVTPGSVIALDASTTIGVFAESLTGVDDLTAVTNGLRAFRHLHGRPQLRAYLTGGEQEDANEALVGTLAEEAVRQFAIDVAFISTMSLDPEFGTSEMTLKQASFKRALVDSARTTVVALDAGKLATKARFRALSLTSQMVLVTELDPADGRLDPYRGQVSRVL